MVTRKVDLEALTIALLTRRRQDVAEEFGVPYNALCGYAQMIGIPVQASTIYGGYTRAVEFLEGLDDDEEVAKSVLFAYAHIKGGSIQKSVYQLIATRRPDLLTRIARRSPKPDWLIERRNARRRKTVEFFTKENLTNITELAKKIGVSRESIYQYLDEAGVKLRTKAFKRSRKGKKRARNHG
jgi:hypothetical protein